MIPNIVRPKSLDPCHGRTRLYGPEWPDPPHCDADGDFLQEEEEETINNKPHCDDYSFQGIKITTKE